TAAHPGYAATNLQFHSGRRLLDLISVAGNRLLAQDEDGGALPTLYAAAADIPGNSFAGPSFMEQRGPAKLVGRSDAARDTDVARRLWDVSEELTGVRFPLGAPAAASGRARPATGRSGRASPGPCRALAFERPPDARRGGSASWAGCAMQRTAPSRSTRPQRGTSTFVSRSMASCAHGLCPRVRRWTPPSSAWPSRSQTTTSTTMPSRARPTMGAW